MGISNYILTTEKSLQDTQFCCSPVGSIFDTIAIVQHFQHNLIVRMVPLILLIYVTEKWMYIHS